MKSKITLIIGSFLILWSCSSQKKLAYLGNLSDPRVEEKFALEFPDYKIQNKDILYITLKAMDPEGQITDFLASSGTGGGANFMYGDAGAFLYGYDVRPDGTVSLPVIGLVNVEGKTLEETRIILQEEFNKHYKNAILECKLLSFKFTVIGEVKAPGTYINYNNYLTVLEAIGRAGGVGDYGNRNRILVVRPYEKGTKTYRLNLQDKSILSSEAYFLLPNDVVIIEPLKQKIFNLNLPTLSFIITSSLSALTTTLLLINYFGK
jgi:polysaccharide biosynthesis/export protein